MVGSVTGIDFRRFVHIILNPQQSMAITVGISVENDFINFAVCGSQMRSTPTNWFLLKNEKAHFFVLQFNSGAIVEYLHEFKYVHVISNKQPVDIPGRCIHYTHNLKSHVYRLHL